MNARTPMTTAIETIIAYARRQLPTGRTGFDTVITERSSAAMSFTREQSMQPGEAALRRVCPASPQRRQPVRPYADPHPLARLGRVHRVGDRGQPPEPVDV